MAAFLLLFHTLLDSASAQHLSLHVDPKDGSFQIMHDGNSWLSGGEVQVSGLSSSAGSLKVGTSSQSEGTDPIGSYESTSLTWVDANDSTGDVLMTTSFRTYSSDPSCIVFEQSFPKALGRDLHPHAHRRLDNFDTCRIVVHSFTLTHSQNGYTAFTKSKPSDKDYTPHRADYCNSGHKWAYSGNENEADCQTKCNELDCVCFDVRPPGPSPAPSGLAARTIFPAFSRGGLPSDDLDAFGYHGVFPRLRKTTLGSYAESHQGGVPLVIYDSKNTSLPMTVFSPLNLPKAHHMATSKDFVGAGVKSTATSIPAGHSQMFILSAGVGVNKGFLEWGDRVLKFTGKARENNMYRDVTHSTIGFWTDNGGYYHYSTGTDASKTYEDVLPQVKAYHDSIGVPFGHWQFDSWFYPKDGGVNPGGGGGAVVNWTSMTGPNSGGTVIFPSGMEGIQKKLAANTSGSLTPGMMPMVMHNRQWSVISDYIKHWTDIPWYKSKKAAIPHDPVKFFNRFFTQQEGWGLTMYEQDWMCTEYDLVEELQTNLTLADLWLEGMATGASGSNRTIQYCMPYPNDVLAASSHAAVTNARATGDYFHAANQWAVGGTSLFYWAINVLPFKDGFYSSTNKQVGGQTVGPERNPDRETLMATLSGAMVGPMDGIYLLNKTRIMTTCMSDGTVLKPDKPISTSDYCFTKADPECFVYSTYSEVPGLGRVVYYFNNADKYKTLEASMVGLPSSDKINLTHAVYNWYTEELFPMKKSQAIATGYEGHVYATVVPILSGGWILLGETNKYATHASIRFKKVESSSSGLTLNVAGVKGEQVKICAAKAADMLIICQHVALSDTSATITFH